MKKHLIISALAGIGLLFSINTYAQISEGGKPFSFNPYNAGNLSASVPTVAMPYIDVEQLKQEDVYVDKIKDIPWRFGENIEVNLNPENNGITEILPNGDKLWRLRIYSQGATSINLTFDNYRLPSGAKLFIYNDDHSDVIGAFTDFNNQEDRVFATTLIRGDAITLEYYEPSEVAFPGELNINMVTHGYRGPFDYIKGLNTSGSCQINVKCPTGNGWEDQINSACMLVSGGNGFCSGSLVNNTANDGTPYVLTANHCYSTPSSWVFWFNWQSSSCTNPSSSPAYNSVSGATLKAKNAGSDFCLVQMNSTPPSNYNVYYAGWDRSGTPPTAGMGIHHPDADIKKISPCNAMTATTYSTAQCWQTPWSGAACTEGGSSGSPIFDQNKRVVGQLYGGPSACGASQMWDYYGRFDISWTGGGTSATRLSDWLDPASTGATVLDGYNPNGAAAPIANFSANVTSSCTGEISFTDQSSYSPTSWLWRFGDGTTSTLQNPTHTYTSSGTFTVKLRVTNTIASDSVTKTDYITINKPVGPAGTDATVCNPSSAVLTASGTGTINWYNSLTSTSILFTGNSYTTPVLNTSTTYYAETIVEGASYNGGKTDNSGSGANLTNQNQYLKFNCLTPVKLVSVKVYASATGNRTFQLRNSGGAVLQEATVNITSTTGAFTVPLNFDVPVGTDLQLGLSSSSTCNLFRNDGGVSYPYTITGIVSITTSSASTNPLNYYYYFYDWVVKENDCVSNRTAITANVMDCSGVGEIENWEITVYPNPSSGGLNISFDKFEGTSLSIQFFNVMGQKLSEESLMVSSMDFIKTYDLSGFNSGIYFIRITTGTKQYLYKIEKQ